MVTPEVLEYIKKKSAGGAAPEAIRTELANTGWQPADIDEAMQQAGLATTATPVSATPDIPPVNENLPPVGAPAVSAPGVAQSTPPMTQPGTNMPPVESVQATTPATGPITAAPEEKVPGYVEPEESKKGKGGILAVVIALLVLIGGGAAYGAYWYVSSNPDPMDILMGAVNAQTDITSAQVVATFDMDMDVTTEVDLGDEMQEVGFEFDYGVDFSGAYDIADSQNVKLDGSFDIDVGGEVEGVSMAWGAMVDLKVIDKLIYLRLRDAEPFMFFDFSPFEDEWILIDVEQIAEDAGLTEEDMTLTNSTLSLELQEKMLQRLSEEFSDQSTISMLREGVTLVGVEDLQGVPTYHLVIKYSKETWKVIIQKYMNVLFDMMAEEEMQNLMLIAEDAGTDIDTQIADAKEELQELMQDPGFVTFLEIIAEMQADMWVGKKDLYTYRTAISLNVTDKVFQVDENEAKVDVKLNYDVTLANINVAVKVDQPTNFTDIESLMEDVMEEMYYTEGIYLEDEMYGAIDDSMDVLEDATHTIDPKSEEELELEQAKAISRAFLTNTSMAAELYYDENEFSYGTRTVGDCSTYLGDEGSNMFEGSDMVAENIQSIRDQGVEVTCVIAEGGQSYAMAIKFTDGETSCIDSLGHIGPAVKIIENQDLDAVVCQE